MNLDSENHLRATDQAAAALLNVTATYVRRKYPLATALLLAGIDERSPEARSRREDELKRSGVNEVIINIFTPAERARRKLWAVAAPDQGFEGDPPDWNSLEWDPNDVLEVAIQQLIAGE